MDPDRHQKWIQVGIKWIQIGIKNGSRSAQKNGSRSGSVSAAKRCRSTEKMEEESDQGQGHHYSLRKVATSAEKKVHLRFRLNY